jgi:hypothetical protein
MIHPKACMSLLLRRKTGALNRLACLAVSPIIPSYDGH